MIKHLSILFVLFVSFIGSSQSDTLNRTDDNGVMYAYWIYYGKDQPQSGYCANCPIEAGYIKDNHKHGLWTKFYKDSGQVKLSGYYVNNRPNGSYQKYYPNGVLKEKGTYIKHKYNGLLERYHESGCRWYTGYYNDSGKEDSLTVYYYDYCDTSISSSGQLDFMCTYDNGTPVDTAYRYYLNGDVKERIVYGSKGTVRKSKMYLRVNDAFEVEIEPDLPVDRGGCGGKFKPDGYNKVYNENDEIWQEGEFKNGALWNGNVYTYDNDGILLKIKIFRKGVYTKGEPNQPRK